MWPNSSLQNYSLASNSYEKVGLAIWDFYKRMDSNNGLKLQTNQSTIEKGNCFSYLHNYIDLTNDVQGLVKAFYCIQWLCLFFILALACRIEGYRQSDIQSDIQSEW